MAVYSIFFSPTGGTKKVMDVLAQALSEAVTEIDLTERDMDFASGDGKAFKKEDICLIGVPSYGGRVPDIAVKRISRLRAEGTPAVLIVVYGNRAYEDTLLELGDTASACGFTVAAAVGAVAEHSIMHQYGAGRPDASDQKELAEFAGKIRARLDSEAEWTSPSLPGSRPYKAYNGVPLKPKAGKQCTGCGRCAAACPAGAVPKDRPQETETALCISCMRCIQICTVSCRSLNRVMLTASSQLLKSACEKRKKNELFL